VGPNGAGKTLMLSLIAADNPQAYSNEIYLFGKRRGSGESIWDIKRRIGMVSSEFQVRYRKHMSAFEVVLSGFFDSVGLYRRSSPAQREIAREWMATLRLNDMAERSFDQLSYGEQRMVLLARCMVKSPLLLILDEPCQGLDSANRKTILDLIDFVGKNNQSHILYVTHHMNEIPSCITHTLRFDKLPAGTYTATSNQM
jgi:molybdate transport system ATP-binding protein